MRAGPLVLAALVAVLFAGCSADDDPVPVASVTLDTALRDELLEMAAADQAERTGAAAGDGDADRAFRLQEIIAENGWPGTDLVGDEGDDAAWTVAQHADSLPDVQVEALEALREAVAEDRASPGNLAYLEDRVAVNAGEPQTYGTQIACSAGGAAPSTPIEDEAGVDTRREAAGLEPLADYLAELSEMCAQDPVG